MQSQRKLGQNTSALLQVFERLSSGQRINRASDDAAGLAIADSLRSDSRVFNVARRNINDGISLLNIMGSALSSQKQILFRLGELAEQSANGVYSNEQRNALNGEYQALVDEFGRIGDSSTFNGLNLLLAGRSDNPEDIQLQAGIDGEIHSILQVMGADTGTFSGVITTRTDVSDGSFNVWQDTPDGTVNANDFTYSTLIETQDGATFEQLATYANNNLFRLSVAASNGETKEVIGFLSYGDNAGDNAASIAFFEKVGEDSYDFLPALSQQTQTEREADILTHNVTFDDGSSGDIILDYRGLEIHSDNNDTIRQTSIEFTGVETEGRALHALDRINNRIDEFSQVEGNVGSIQSRLETAARVVNSARENSLAAESRIRDADIATDSSELARLQILQQTATAVLAQANQQPQIALQLLG